MNLPVTAYPGLELHGLVATLPQRLEQLPSPAWLQALLRLDAEAPVRSSEPVRLAVRDLLRVHGYRPTGRGKPSSEYLAAAVGDGRVGSINAVVDAGNVASLHSGLPISIVDLDLCQDPLSVRVPPPGSKYVFNRSGQEIDVAGLLSLCDAEGPCANAVKDAQRTKTQPATVRVLGVVWGASAPDAQHASATAAWLGELFARLGAAVDPVEVVALGP
ncbi:MAG TPA: phenylalanine--tRNA ligase beta subunit-related protein [Planctomycetota bacterium]|nr:phenylalanine--tRNA ligase beta subunit-related protein [Planctomycetota bacterium]